MSASLNGVIPAQTGRAKTFAPSFPRYIAKGNGISFINDFSHTFVGDFDIEFIWQRMDTASGQSSTELAGSRLSSANRILAADSTLTDVAIRNRLSIVVGGNFAFLTDAFVGVEQGEYVKIKFIRRGIIGGLYINGVFKGNLTNPMGGDFIVDSIGLTGGAGTEPFNSVIADVKWTDYAELPKGQYLLGDGTAYVQVNIPVVSGDVIEFDYVPDNTGATQRMLGSVISDRAVTHTNTNALAFNAGLFTVKVDGESVTNGSRTFIDGVKVSIELTVIFSTTLTVIGNDGGLTGAIDGTIANFTVNGTEYIYPLKAPYITDNGDGTAIALQTGSVAEFGSELVVNGDYSTGWTSTDSPPNGVVTVDNGELSIVTDGAFCNITKAFAVTVGKTYTLTVPIVMVEGLAAVVFEGVQYNGELTSYTFTKTIVATDTSISVEVKRFSGGQASSFSSPSISLRETSNGLIPVFDAATNLVDYASNVVSYPIDEQDGVELAEAANYSVLTGLDNTLSLVTASSFTSTFVTSVNRIYINFNTVIGKTYKITNIKAGAGTTTTFIKDTIDGGGANITSDFGDADLYFIATATAHSILWSNATDTFSVSNISVRENNLNVLAYDENGARWEGVELVENGDFATADGWTMTGDLSNISGGAMTVGASTTNGNGWQDMGLIVGQEYRVSIEGLSYDANSFVLLVNSSRSDVVENSIATLVSAGVATGITTAKFTALSTRIGLFVAGGAVVGSITNISVKQTNDALWTPDADHVFQGGFVGEGAVLVTDGTAAPDHFANGLPYEADGSLAVDSVSAITGVSAAIPVTAVGRIATGTTPARANMGAMPLTADGRLVMAAGAVSHYSSGVPYTAVPQIAAIFK